MLMRMSVELSVVEGAARNTEKGVVRRGSSAVPAVVAGVVVVIVRVGVGVRSSDENF